MARFASWNLRWFPDGTPGSSEPGTDVAWVACVLSWLDADVVALQEMKGTPKAERAIEELLGELNQLTGRRYVMRLDDCGSRVPQHVGLLFDEARLKLSELQTVAELNPSGSPCENQWRPGLSGRFAFPGGLDLFVVSAHFKSQDDARSLSLRRASFAAAAGVKQRAEQGSHDGDWLLLGDLNTMGCEDCQPPIAASEELTAVRQLLAKGGLRLVEADASGTELHAGRYSWLDHALASSSMRELAASAKVHVAGPCGQAPGRATRMPLSDHCPVLLDLSDRDLD